jgi:hypothetical protein
MSASDVARHHFDAALDQADAASLDRDGLCRALLGLVVSEYLRTRYLPDVQAELRFAADNRDPDTDFAFMRP